MMENLRILKGKEVKNIHQLLKNRFGFSTKLDTVFLVNSRNRIYLINKDFAKLDISKLRVNSVGLYFGESFDGNIRLSIEGSQLLGKNCIKNVLELDQKHTKEWLAGYDLQISYPDKGFVLIKHNNDFLGCGKAVEGKILNYVPKNRRLKLTH